MKRLFTLPLLVAAFVAVSAAAPAAASAASCSVTAKGGEKVPVIGDDNSINEAAAQGYKCTVAWITELVPQYESSGTWHYANEIAPAFHPNTPDKFWPPNTAYNWSLITNAEGDGDVALFATSPTYTPTCHFNWRWQLNFSGTNHFVFFTDVSPVASKTC